jgi:hypothetical protein
MLGPFGLKFPTPRPQDSFEIHSQTNGFCKEPLTFLAHVQQLQSDLSPSVFLFLSLSLSLSFSLSLAPSLSFSLSFFEASLFTFLHRSRSFEEGGPAAGAKP